MRFPKKNLIYSSTIFRRKKLMCNKKLGSCGLLVFRLLNVKEHAKAMLNTLAYVM